MTIQRYHVAKRLSEKLSRPVAIRAIRINPFALSARVLGFSMEDRAGTGKTETLASLISDSVEHSPCRRILAVAPTNRAVDELTCSTLSEQPERP